MKGAMKGAMRGYLVTFRTFFVVSLCRFDLDFGGVYFDK